MNWPRMQACGGQPSIAQQAVSAWGKHAAPEDSDRLLTSFAWKLDQRGEKLTSFAWKLDQSCEMLTSFAWKLDQRSEKLTSFAWKLDQ